MSFFWTLFYARRTWKALFSAVFLVFFTAGSFAEAIKKPPTDDVSTAALQEAFEILGVIGAASNAGGGAAASQEGMRQGCALLKDRASGHFDAQLQKQASFVSGWVGEFLKSQGSGAGNRALQMACDRLSGDSGGSLDMKTSLLGVRDSAINTAFGRLSSYLKDTGLPFTGSLELETSVHDGDILWSATTVEPIWASDDGLTHLFTQLSWNKASVDTNSDSRPTVRANTLNVGFALRQLNEAKTFLYGGNVFFDHETTMNHNRFSLGVDAQTSLLGFAANRYIPLSSWKRDGLIWEERAAAGWDAELQGRLPQYPHWQANARAYRWSGSGDGLRDYIVGYNLGFEWSPATALTVSAGYNDEQDAAPSFNASLRLVYRFGEPIEDQWEERAALQDVSSRVYSKVKRDNSIRVERRRQSSSFVSVLETTGVNTIANDFGTASASFGQSVAMPATLTVDATGGSILRLGFADGGVLTLAAGTVAIIAPDAITLTVGSLQYVSGTTIHVVNVSGGKINLLGTDIDARVAGGVGSVRVRDGSVRVEGDATGDIVIGATQMAQLITGVASVVTSGAPAYTTHVNDIASKIDTVAQAQTGTKVAPYPTETPRMVTNGNASGQTIVIGLRFNDVVNVAGGTPRLNLTVAGHVRTASLSGGSGTNDLLFSYTLQPSDEFASDVVVSSLDVNGATLTGAGKAAVTTILGVTLPFSGTVGDVTAPAGYSAAFVPTVVTNANKTSVSFDLSAAEVGATANYTITSSGGAGQASASVAVTSASQTVSGIDVSALPDGTLTLSVTLSDAAINNGAAATDTVLKDATAPYIASVTPPANGTYAP